MAVKKFIKGVFYLSFTGALLRGVGMLFRIWLSGQLGETGMGLYQLVLSVYMLGAAIAGAGLSVAVTRLVSIQCVEGGREGIRRLLRTALCWGMGVGAATAIILFSGAPLIAARWIGDAHAAQGVRILSLGLPCIAASACFNGYFLGVGRVNRSCLAQIAEQAVRISTVVLLFQRNADLSAVWIGTALSEGAAALILYVFYLQDVRRIAVGDRRDPLFGPFLAIQLPIAAGRLVTSLLHTAENLLVPLQLAKFSNKDAALADFGALKGMALPLVMFPSSLLMSLAGMLAPELTGAATLRQGDRVRDITARTLHLTFLCALFMGGFFYRFGEPLGALIYHSDSVGTILRRLSPAIPFMYLDCITDGLLKGTGEQLASLRYNLLDSGVRISLVFFLLPHRGLSAFLWIILLSNAALALMGLRRLIRITDTPLPWKQGLILPAFGLLICHLISTLFATPFLAMAVYGGGYLLFILIFGLHRNILHKNPDAVIQ